MRKMLGTAVSLFVTLFFMGIIIFIMCEGMHLPDKDTWGGIITFTVIEFIILLAVIGLGKYICQYIGVGFYTPLCTMTIVYAVVGTILNLILSGSSSFVVILINLILLFVYAMIVLPFVVKGVNTRGGDFPVDPTNPNNMPVSSFLNKAVNNMPANNTGFGANGMQAPQNPNNLPTMGAQYGGVNGQSYQQPVQQAQAPASAPAPEPVPAMAAAPVQQSASEQPAAAPAFCPECGQRIAAGTKFCVGCGKKLFE